MRKREWERQRNQIHIRSHIHMVRYINTYGCIIRRKRNGQNTFPKLRKPKHKSIWECRIKITEIDSILCFIEPFDERLNQKSRQNGQMNEWASTPSLNIYFIYFYVFFLRCRYCHCCFYCWFFFFLPVMWSCVSVACDMFSFVGKLLSETNAST